METRRSEGESSELKSSRRYLFPTLTYGRLLPDDLCLRLVVGHLGSGLHRLVVDRRRSPEEKDKSSLVPYPIRPLAIHSPVEAMPGDQLALAQQLLAD